MISFNAMEAAGRTGGRSSGTTYVSHRQRLPQSLRRGPRAPGPTPNVVLIGSPNNELPLREVHKGLARFPGVVACSRILDLSAYRKQNLVDFADRNRMAGRDQEAVNASLDSLILDAAKTARIALVVNVEPELEGIGDIRPEECYGQIKPILDDHYRPVWFMNEVPKSSEFYLLTPGHNGLPPENVVGGCLAAVAQVALNGSVS